MRLDLTPRGWSGYDREQIGAVIAYVITEWPLEKVVASRRKLIVETHPDLNTPAPEAVERVRVAIVKMGPWGCEGAEGG